MLKTIQCIYFFRVSPSTTMPPPAVVPPYPAIHRDPKAVPRKVRSPPALSPVDSSNLVSKAKAK